MTPLHDCSRRAFLRRLGVAAAAAPFIPALEATAQSIPKRLLVFYQPHGTTAQAWTPEGTETNFQLSLILEPLSIIKDKIVVVDGLEATATSGGGHDHVRAAYGLTTGRSTITGGVKGHPTGPSFDQVIAQRVGSTTPHASLQFGVGNPGGFSIVSTGPSAPVPPEIDPVRQFERLFAASGADATADAAALRRNAARQSVLDFVRQSLAPVRTHVGHADRHRIDAHLEAVRAIEKTLQDGGVSSGVCTKPNAPPAGIDPLGSDAFPTVGPLQQQLMTASLACDLTRVATLQWGHHGGGTTFTWVGVSKNYHHTAHRGHVPPLENAVDYLPAAKWFAGQFADLVQRLDAVDVGDGTLLDHTLVCWLSAVGHGVSPVPVVLAGGSRLGLRTGRYLHYNGGLTSDLMVSLGQMMGLTDLATFGDPAHCNGPLVGLT